MAPVVSVIVPVLADREPARALLAQIPADPRLEVIVTEAGAEPGLESLADGRPALMLIHSAAGRGTQMNAGAGLARGDWLLFLHADSRLPDGWFDLFQATVRKPEHRTIPDPGSRVPDPGAVIGGWFRFALDDSAWQARVIERGVAWRSRRLKLPYGDQGLFVRRDTFRALGGYREWPLMEDVEFVRRLARAGPLVEVPATITTSARRWRRDGWFRRSMRNLTLLTLYYCGVPPSVLARWY